MYVSSGSRRKDLIRMTVANPAAETVVWQRPVPASLRSLSPMTDVDYSDLVVGQADPTAERTPEEWAEVMLGGLPKPLRALIPVVHRGVLGLRLQLRPAPDRMLGWRIAEREERRVRLAAEGWLIAADVVVSMDASGAASLATFIRYESPLARIVWPPVSLLHRYAAVLLVRAAATAEPSDAC
jgi:hypothetical protein